MTPTAIALVLLSAAIHVGWNYIAKSSSDPRSFFALPAVPIILLTIVMSAFIDLTALPQTVLQFAVLSGLVHAVYFIALGSAYANAPVSLVYPIVRSAPALVPIGAFYLIGETISQRGMVGIGIVVAAILTMGWQSERSKSGANPGPSTSSAEAETTPSTTTIGLLWSIATLFIVVVYTLVDKSAMQAFSQSDSVAAIMRGPVFFLLQGSIAHGTLWLILLFRGVRPRDFSQVDWLKGVAVGIFMMASYSIILAVLQTEKVSYVVTLRQASMVIATLIGWLVLKETGGRTRFLISLVLVAGLILVATAE